MHLSDVCEINPKAPSIDDSTEVSFVTMADVSEDGKMNTAVVRPYAEVKKGYSFFQENDVLFAKITPCMENGKGALAKGLKNGMGCGSTEFHILRPNSTAISGEWLYYLTAWSSFRRNAEQHMTGSAGQKRVPKCFLESYRLTVPSLGRQKQQVEQLDCIKKTIELREQQLSKLDDLIKARFVEMFGDMRTNPKGWSIQTFEELTELITDGEHATPKRVDRGIYLLSARNVLNHSLNLEDVDYIDQEEYDRIAKRIVPREGDVLISCSGTVGRCCSVPSGMVFQMVRSAALLRFKPLINPVFAEYMITSDYLQEQINSSKTASSQANLFQGKIAKLRGFVPPIELQNDFLSFVNQVEKSKAAVQKALDEARLLFDSMMQEYFR